MLNVLLLFSGRPAPRLHWLINGRPAPDKIVKDNIDPNEALGTLLQNQKQISSSSVSVPAIKFITSNSSFLPFNIAQPSHSTLPLSNGGNIQALRLNPMAMKNQIAVIEKSKGLQAPGRKLQNKDTNIHNLETEAQLHLQGMTILNRSKKSVKTTLSNTKNRNTKLYGHNINGFVRGVRKGIVTSSLMVGAVQRKNVDTTYTCLASNSNMTQASRANVKLQMNRKLAKFYNVNIHFVMQLYLLLLLIHRNVKALFQNQILYATTVSSSLVTETFKVLHMHRMQKRLLNGDWSWIKVWDYP